MLSIHWNPRVTAPTWAGGTQAWGREMAGSRGERRNRRACAQRRRPRNGERDSRCDLLVQPVVLAAASAGGLGWSASASSMVSRKAWLFVGDSRISGYCFFAAFSSACVAL